MEDNTEEELFQLYREKFLPIYADLVSIKKSKPIQTLVEIENIFAHLASAKVGLPEDRSNNIAKANGHMMRATLDASKMVWLAWEERFNVYFLNFEMRKFVINCSEREFIDKYHRAEKLAKEARIMETTSIGSDLFPVIDAYSDATTALKAVYDQIDPDKAEQFRKKETENQKALEKVTWLNAAKLETTGFILGIGAGVISSVAVTLAFKFFK